MTKNNFTVKQEGYAGLADLATSQTCPSYKAPESRKGGKQDCLETHFAD